nr:DUF1326 domain-containing protein [Bradyrhizobium sp. CCBAU 53415]
MILRRQTAARHHTCLRCRPSDRISRGPFEGVKLDGLCFAVVVDFPGALHQGNGKMQPIGAPHRIQVVMPEGFEHRAAEVASANLRSTGAIPFETQGTHSSLANVVQTPEGVAARCGAAAGAAPSVSARDPPAGAMRASRRMKVRLPDSSRRLRMNLCTGVRYWNTCSTAIA